jgi:hypothetical protein
MIINGTLTNKLYGYNGNINKYDLFNSIQQGGNPNP